MSEESYVLADPRKVSEHARKKLQLIKRYLKEYEEFRIRYIMNFERKGLFRQKYTKEQARLKHLLCPTSCFLDTEKSDIEDLKQLASFAKPDTSMRITQYEVTLLDMSDLEEETTRLRKLNMEAKKETENVQKS